MSGAGAILAIEITEVLPEAAETEQFAGPTITDVAPNQGE